MFETKHTVTIECPGLVKAITALGAIVAGTVRPDWDSVTTAEVKPGQSAVPAAAQPVPPPPPTPVQPAPPVQQPAQALPPNLIPRTTVPAQPMPPAYPQAAPAAAPTQPAPMAPPPTVPTTAAPAYTLEQISRAGADLVSADPTKQPVLVQLLQRFGIGTITQLKPEHYGAFAGELRGLGAKL